VVRDLTLPSRSIGEETEKFKGKGEVYTAMKQQAGRGDWAGLAEKVVLCHQRKTTQQPRSNIVKVFRRGVVGGEMGKQ